MFVLKSVEGHIEESMLIMKEPRVILNGVENYLEERLRVMISFEAYHRKGESHLRKEFHAYSEKDQMVIRKKIQDLR